MSEQRKPTSCSHQEASPMLTAFPLAWLVRHVPRHGQPTAVSSPAAPTRNRSMSTARAKMRE
eukprot:6210264-Pleurochrysis_carterae.AAC.1